MEETNFRVSSLCYAPKSGSWSQRWPTTLVSFLPCTLCLGSAGGFGGGFGLFGGQQESTGSSSFGAGFSFGSSTPSQDGNSGKNKSRKGVQLG